MGLSVCACEALGDELTNAAATVLARDQDAYRWSRASLAQGQLLLVRRDSRHVRRVYSIYFMSGWFERRLVIMYIIPMYIFLSTRFDAFFNDDTGRASINKKSRRRVRA